MDSILVVTISGADRAGLVERLASVIAEHSGNWEHCRMAHLADRFVGLLQIRVSGVNQQDLESALRMIDGLDVMLAATKGEAEELTAAQPGLRLELLGSDHPGIVRDVFAALAKANVNVEELHTSTEAAPDSGGMLFRANARLAPQSDLDQQALQAALSDIAMDLMVDLKLSE
ncbi:glycine cleavage system protein R [Coraliomargarita sinensis]|uniref:Glycine cleavage system protein R n=1 Tax=Coraliomargarita sinensis TaxID=2174842 RepID=A0A317ZNB5_9BACT|nr:ACT domain-containing protein [Coraliomargarita sinensis]PXA05677.1 glycine cleavage system protein R [Coraliomargarita sinensis]